jgi:hypothetical protein
MLPALHRSDAQFNSYDSCTGSRKNCGKGRSRPKIISTVRAEAATRRERASSLKPKLLAADTAYGTGHFLGWLVGRGIAPHIPVRDASERDDGTFSRSDFRWDRRHGVSICLHTTGPCTTATCSATAPPNSTAMLVQDAMLSEYGCPTGTP